MGLFSSDYKAHGSISNTQLMPQRHYKDTFFGELIMQNAKTGESVADNVRYDALSGISAHMRGYLKKGLENSFSTTIAFQSSITITEKKNLIGKELGVVVDSLEHEVIGRVSSLEKAYGKASIKYNLYEENHTVSGKNCVAKITISGKEESIQSTVKPPVINNGFDPVNLKFLLCDGTEFDTGITRESIMPNVPGIFTKEGYYTKAVSGTKSYYFYTEDRAFFVGGGSERMRVLPIISLQDNWNNERPYETLPWGDKRYERRYDTLKKLGVDFADLSRGIFAFIPGFNSWEWRSGYGNQWRNTPKLKRKYKTEREYYNYLSGEVNIPAFGSSKWKKNFSRTYKSMKKTCAKKNGRITKDQKKFCSDYPTERSYHDGMVKDKRETAKSINNVSDAHFGFFVSAKTLDEANVAALFYTLEPILSKMNKIQIPISDSTGVSAIGKPGWKPGGGTFADRHVDPYSMSISQGSFIVNYSFEEWSMCRRYGVANPIRYPKGVREPKVGHTFFEVLESGSKPFSLGPAFDPTYRKHREPNSLGSISDMDWGNAFGSGVGGSGMIELRIQDTKDSGAGRPRYLEMRLYKPMAKHKVDVIRDGKHGKSGSVTVVGGLAGINGTDPKKPYSDALMYPVSYEAFRQVKIFKRERLMRETMMVRISAVQMEEVKWYQKGWFKVFMVIAGLVLAWFTGGQSIVAVLKALAVMAVMQILMAVIDNPILRAIIQIAMVFFSGYIMTGSFTLESCYVR